MSYFVLEAACGPSEYFQEHCYTEVVHVYDKIAVVSDVNTASQLQHAHLYTLIGEFESLEQAVEFKNKHIGIRDGVIALEPVQVASSKKVSKQEAKQSEEAWYGKGPVTFS